MTFEDIAHLRVLKAALAEEIRDVRRLIEQIAAVVAADEQFALANLEQLQAFDLAIQRADESADMLERLSNGSPADQAIEAVRLGCVQNRLRAALKSAA
jgi:hypothetical protein